MIGWSKLTQNPAHFAAALRTRARIRGGKNSTLPFGLTVHLPQIQAGVTLTITVITDEIISRGEKIRTSGPCLPKKRAGLAESTDYRDAGTLQISNDQLQEFHLSPSICLPAPRRMHACRFTA